MPRTILFAAIIILFLTACDKDEPKTISPNFDIENSCCNFGFYVRTLNNTIGADYHFWDFGDGNTSNEFEPFHKYKNPEAYKIVYTAKNTSTGEIFMGHKIALVQGSFEYETLDEYPSYVGGDDGYKRYLYKHLNCLVADYNAGVDGTVIIKFTVSRFGTVECAEVYKEAEENLNAIALFPFSIMPNWEHPAYLDGEAVSLDLYQPINFESSKANGVQITLGNLKFAVK